MNPKRKKASALMKDADRSLRRHQRHKPHAAIVALRKAEQAYRLALASPNVNLRTAKAALVSAQQQLLLAQGSYSTSTKKTSETPYTDVDYPRSNMHFVSGGGIETNRRKH